MQILELAAHLGGDLSHISGERIANGSLAGVCTLGFCPVCPHCTLCPMDSTWLLQAVPYTLVMVHLALTHLQSCNADIGDMLEILSAFSLTLHTSAAPTTPRAAPAQQLEGAYEGSPGVAPPASPPTDVAHMHTQRGVHTEHTSHTYYAAGTDQPPVPYDAPTAPLSAPDVVQATRASLPWRGGLTAAATMSGLSPISEASSEGQASSSYVHNASPVSFSL